MKFFGKKNKIASSKLPPAIQAFSEAEHRERVGMAWLIGIASLLITVIILTALYFGGAWLYRKVAGNDQPAKPIKTETTQKPEDKPREVKDQPQKQDNSSQKGQTAISSDSTNKPAKAAKATPKTGDDSQESLVRTGPDVDL